MFSAIRLANTKITIKNLFGSPNIIEIKEILNEKNVEKKSLNINLEKESIIDIDFKDISKLPRFDSNPKKIFITGVTGF